MGKSDDVDDDNVDDDNLCKVDGERVGHPKVYHKLCRLGSRSGNSVVNMDADLDVDTIVDVVVVLC